MSFRCFSCGISFDTVAKFVEHKFAEHRPVHQEQPKKVVIQKVGAVLAASKPHINFVDSGAKR